MRAPAHSGFRADEAYALAERVLASPPARPHIVRPVPRGRLVARFALPLELCKPMNNVARSGSQPWALGKMKSDALIVMLGQHGRLSAPLAGVPQVLCLRLSSSEPDKYANWAKNPVDRLLVKNRGLGYLRDDRPTDAEVHEWWEPGPRGKGCVVIEVRA